jgi:hypothetical protein
MSVDLTVLSVIVTCMSESQDMISGAVPKQMYEIKYEAYTAESATLSGWRVQILMMIQGIKPMIAVCQEVSG